MGASLRAGRGSEGGERRGRGAEKGCARARPRTGRARALPLQGRPRPPLLSAPAREPGPRAAAAGGTMSGAARAGPARLAAFALLTCSLWPARADNASQEYYTALINVTVQEPGRGAPLTFRIDRGRYGLDSPKAEVRGQVLAPLPIHGVADHLGCDPQTRFFVPPNIKQWIALLQRGNCTFKEKISRAAFHNAVAVVIYNNKSKEEPVTMTHPGTGDIIAVMITELRGKDILSYLEKNISVQMTIAVGTRMPPKNFSRGSLVFVSISFIVLMIISSAWLIFYFIQKIRYTNARDRNQRRLGDAAKKAISKLTTRTVKKGDKETDPDFDHCAVCIESYKQNDVVRILPCKSCTAPRGCRAVKTTRLQCRRLTPPPAIVLITLAYSVLGSRRVGRHCVSVLLVLFPFMFYTSTYPPVFLYPKVFLIGIKDFSEALTHLSFTRLTVREHTARFPFLYTAQP